jgi:peptide/nickel transport system substrate-binding protein
MYTYPWGSGERGDHPEPNPTVPLLAAGAPVISENGTVYTIKLRQGITFHDGTPFNASAAVWNLKRAMKMFSYRVPVHEIAELIRGGTEMKDAYCTYGGTSDQFRAAFETWEASGVVEATGTYEITYRLEEPAAFFIPLMTTSVGYMMSPTFAEKHATTPGASFGVDYDEEFTYMYNHTCGTGPYQVIEWRTNQYVHMVLDENYWRASATEAAIATPSYAGSIKEILYRFNNGVNITSHHLETGVVDDTDWPTTYTDEIYDNVTHGSKNPNIFFRTGGSTIYGEGLLFEMGTIWWDGGWVSSPFHWRGLRKAMAYIFDHDAFIQAAHRGWAFRSKGPIPVGMPYHNSSCWTAHYDPEIAVEYWNEAMQDPNFVDVMNTVSGQIHTYYLEGQSVDRHAYLLLQDGFEAMKLLPQMNITGLEFEPRVTVYEYSWSDMLNREHKDPPMMQISSWSADYADPNSLMFECLHSRGYWPERQSYNNSIMDDLIKQGRAETDPDVRLQIYSQIQELAAHDQPSMWLYSHKEFTTFRAWLKGIGLRYQPMSSYYYIYHVYKNYDS